MTPKTANNERHQWSNTTTTTTNDNINDNNDNTDTTTTTTTNDNKDTTNKHIAVFRTPLARGVTFKGCS